MNVHEIKYICNNNILYELAELEDQYDQDDIMPEDRLELFNVLP